MAKYGIVHFFKGGTSKQYDNTVKVVHPDGGKGLPAGQTYHAAGETDEGFVVVAIWESKGSWEKFRDETLLSGFEKVDDSLPAPPQEFAFDVHNELTG
jgi:hypothetical protein